VHFDPISTKTRFKESQYLIQVMKSWPLLQDEHCRVIIVGDMNFQTQEEVDLHAFIWNRSQWTLVKGFGDTNVDANVSRPYDHMIYYSKSITVNNAKCIEFDDMTHISDHYPIEADVWFDKIDYKKQTLTHIQEIEKEAEDIKHQATEEDVRVDEKQNKECVNETKDYYTTNVTSGIYHLYPICGSFKYTQENKTTHKIIQKPVPITFTRLCKKCIRRKL
jgi:hypothetical protein